MSITAFNIRLTSMSSKTWKIVNWCFFALCGAYTVAAFFLNIFQCDPPGASFDLFIVARSGKPPVCAGVSDMSVRLRLVNIVLDYCLLSVPVAVIWKVQMSWSKKLRLFAALGVGSLACIGSVMTLVSKFQLKSDALVSCPSSSGPSVGGVDLLLMSAFKWNYTGILGWSCVELTVGVVAASLPTFAFLLPKSMKSEQQQQYKQSTRCPGATDEHSHKFRTPREEWGSESDMVGIVRTTEIDIEMRGRTSSDVDSRHDKSFERSPSRKE